MDQEGSGTAPTTAGLVPSGTARFRPGAPFYCFAAAVVAGAVLRFHDIAARPLHHDEGVNALFLLDLARAGRYRYDPTNYHGPLLYYMVAPLLRLLGETTAVLRFWPALLGTALIAVSWSLRRATGDWGAAFAAWLLALSPIGVYFSRDTIHESWYVAAAALIGGGAAAHAASGRRGWVVAAWVGFAALVATKETAPIVVAALAAGGLAAALAAGPRELPSRLRGHLRRNWRTHSVGAGLALVLLAVLFTSLGNLLVVSVPVEGRQPGGEVRWNPRGFVDMFRAYAVWTKTGTAGAGHEKPWTYFAEILWRYERLAFVLGGIGLAVAAIRREIAVGLGVAGLALAAVHSAIPYKTPWLIWVALPWLAGSAGYLADRALAALPRGWPRLAAGAALALGLVLTGREAYRLSFVDHDDSREAIVYSQTVRDFLGLVQGIEAAAAASPRGLALPVDVMSRDHFPLNWYTRGFAQVSYWSKVQEPRADAVIVIQREDLNAVRGSLAGPHRAATFALRPGVELTLLVAEDLFERARPGIASPERYTVVGPVAIAALSPAVAGEEGLFRGLLARGFAAARIEGEPVWSEPGRPVHVDYDHGENHEWRPPFAIEWSGLLAAPADGLYRFSLASDDGSTLEIGSALVIDNWGEHALREVGGTVQLAAGMHAIRLAYSDHGGGAKLVFRWTPPGGIEQAVPAEALFHRR